MLKWIFCGAKMDFMIRRLFILLFVASWLIAIADAQGVQADLLRRVNSLRQSHGLSGYTPHSALNAAAANHAGWLARTGVNSHYQEDGAGPKSRAANAGYSSNWVSENYYFGLNATAERAWNFWLNSPGHYAGLVSPYYDNIGIAAASASGRTAYVLVFGNAAGRLANSNSPTESSVESAGRAAPSYVVGLDEVGNILHKVQSGDTLGDIALIYGYTWEDIAYMLEINGMTADDIRVLQPGSIFLVPPKDGTFTPTPPSPEPTQIQGTATPVATSTPSPVATQTATPPTPTTRMRVGPAAPSISVSPDGPLSGDEFSAERLVLPALLTLAALAQAGIILGASFLLVRYST